MKIDIDIDRHNKELRNLAPEAILDWALTLSDRRIVTTSFGKYSAVLLSTFARKDPNIDVVWCDTGFNLPETYDHAQYLIERLKLRINTYVPRYTRAYTEHRLGFPSHDDPGHAEFSDIVKLEPFRRALAAHDPDIWFTNIRVRQTALRSAKDILSYSKGGILKVSPFYYCTDHDLDHYLDTWNLPKNSTYFDPVKALETRECGIHLQ